MAVSKTVLLTIAARAASGAAGVIKSFGGDVARLKAQVEAAGSAAAQTEPYRRMQRELAGTAQAARQSAQGTRAAGQAAAVSAGPVNNLGAGYAGLKGQLEAAGRAAGQVAQYRTLRREMAELALASRRGGKEATAARQAWRAKVEELRRVSAAAKAAGVDTQRLNAQVRTQIKLLAAQKGALAKARAGQEMRQKATSDWVGVAAPALLLAGPLKAAMNYESAMADVRKVVDFPTPDGLEKLSLELRKMATTNMPLKPEELAAIAAAGGQLGVTADKLPKFVTTTAKMAVAFDMTAERAGEASAKLSNVFKIPVEQIEALGDAVNYLSDNTAAKASDMVDTLTRVGGSAKMFGLSAQRTAALANAFLALGKPPEVAATAINAMLAKLMTADKGTKEFSKALQAMGLSGRGLKAAIAKDGAGALDDFLERLAALDQGQRMGVLVDLFGMEHADELGTLVGSLDQYRQAVGLVAKEQKYLGSMNREFEVRAQTTANKLKILYNKTYDLATSIGTALLPAFNALGAGLGAAMDMVAGLHNAVPWLTNTVFVLAGGTLAAVTAFKGLRMAGLFLKGGLIEMAGTAKAVALAIKNSTLVAKAWTLATRLGTAATRMYVAAQNFLATTTLRGAAALVVQKTVAGALAAKQMVVAVATRAWAAAQWLVNLAMTANPIGLVIAGVAALAAGAYLLITHWKEVKEFFGGIWTWAAEQVSAFWGWLQGIDLYELGAGLLRGLANGILSVLSLPQTIMEGAWDLVIGWLGGLNLFEAGAKLLATFVDGIKSLAAQPVEMVKSVLAKVREYLPFSDARRGPLSALTASGAAMVATLGRGIAAAGASSLAKPLRQHLDKARAAVAGGLPAGVRTEISALGLDGLAAQASQLATAGLDQAAGALAPAPAGPGAGWPPASLPAAAAPGAVSVTIQQTINAPGATDAAGLKPALDTSAAKIRRIVEDVVNEMYFRGQRVSLGNVN
ncbi:MAG: phage tail tape measure protein [Deltaproteobacteria bacterium]|nr:phage tail tape measure protein [Deltaproteobacteria bacterium]